MSELPNTQGGSLTSSDRDCWVLSGEGGSWRGQRLPPPRGAGAVLPDVHPRDAHIGPSGEEGTPMTAKEATALSKRFESHRWVARLFTRLPSDPRILGWHRPRG
jgi:hypothetical protein